MVDKYFIETDDGRFMFHCTGCGHSHVFDSRWNITWNDEKPTATPSLLNTQPWKGNSGKRCHLFIKNGKIQYLSDCTHKLKGQTIDMETIDNG